MSLSAHRSTRIPTTHAVTATVAAGATTTATRETRSLAGIGYRGRSTHKHASIFHASRCSTWTRDRSSRTREHATANRAAATGVLLCLLCMTTTATTAAS